MLARRGDRAQVDAVVFGQFSYGWFGQDFGEEIGFLHRGCFRRGGSICNRFWFGGGCVLGGCCFWLWTAATSSSGGIFFGPGADQRGLDGFIVVGALGDLDGEEVVAHVDRVADFDEEVFDNSGPGAGDFDQ